MTEPSLLTIIGELGNLPTVVVEKFSAAISAFYRPRQIRLIAEAEAHAKKTETMTDIEIFNLKEQALEDRARKRMIAEETRNQRNIKAIADGAILLLNPQADPDSIEKDWMADVLDKCKLISDEEMQLLWSRILAGEANNPGSFSKRTVAILSSLSKEDARIFADLCNYSIKLQDDIIPIILDYSNSIYLRSGLTLERLINLDAIGLIKFESHSNFSFGETGDPTVLTIGEYPYSFVIKLPENQGFDAGQVILTSVGKQLINLCVLEGIDGFEDYVVGEWVRMNYSPANLIPENPPIK
jgi:Protein of unknown function (DUF2806)